MLLVINSFPREQHIAILVDMSKYVFMMITYRRLDRPACQSLSRLDPICRCA